MSNDKTEERCTCGMKTRAECGPDDEWEPGCDLGNNAKHAVAVTSGMAARMKVLGDPTHTHAASWPAIPKRTDPTFGERKAQRTISRLQQQVEDLKKSRDYAYKLAHGKITEDAVKRMQHAVEGECDGLAIDKGQARAILEYVLRIERPAKRSA